MFGKSGFKNEEGRVASLVARVEAVVAEVGRAAEAGDDDAAALGWGELLYLRGELMREPARTREEVEAKRALALRGGPLGGVDWELLRSVRDDLDALAGRERPRGEAVSRRGPGAVFRRLVLWGLRSGWARFGT